MEQMGLPFKERGEDVVRRLINIAKARGHKNIRNSNDEEYFFRQLLVTYNRGKNSMRVKPQSREYDSGFFYVVYEPNRWGAD